MRSNPTPPPPTNYVVLYGALTRCICVSWVIYWYAGAMLTTKSDNAGSSSVAADVTATPQVFEQLPTAVATAAPVQIPATTPVVPATATAVPAES
jgi:hypothetical protein